MESELIYLAVQWEKKKKKKKLIYWLFSLRQMILPLRTSDLLSIKWK